MSGLWPIRYVGGMQQIAVAEAAAPRDDLSARRLTRGWLRAVRSVLLGTVTAVAEFGYLVAWLVAVVLVALPGPHRRPLTASVGRWARLSTRPTTSPSRPPNGHDDHPPDRVDHQTVGTASVIRPADLHDLAVDRPTRRTHAASVIGVG
jgi:hypothetical protein